MFHIILAIAIEINCLQICTKLPWAVQQLTNLTWPTTSSSHSFSPSLSLADKGPRRIWRCDLIRAVRNYERNAKLSHKSGRQRSSRDWGSAAIDTVTEIEAGLMFPALGQRQCLIAHDWPRTETVWDCKGREEEGGRRREMEADSRRLGGLGSSPAAGATHDDDDDDDEGAALSTLETRKRLMAKPESQPGA